MSTAPFASLREHLAPHGAILISYLPRRTSPPRGMPIAAWLSRLTRSDWWPETGDDIVGLTDQSQGGTLYVATTGKPYPVEIAKSGAGGGTLSFDRWNQAVSIAPPANAIDLAQLRAGH